MGNAVTSKLDYVVNDLPSWPLVDIGHFLYIINMNRAGGLGPETYWLPSFVMALLRCNGGGVARNMILAQPIAFLKTSYKVPAVFASWYLINHCPGDVVHKLIKDVPALKYLLAGLEAMSKTRAICGGTAAMMKAMPDSPGAAVLIGALSGSGGMFIADIERRMRQGPGAKANLYTPSFVLKACFWVSLMFYTTTRKGKEKDSESWLTPRQAKFCAAILLLGGYWSRVLWGPKFNPFAHLEALIKAVLRFPPDVAKIPVAVAAVAKSVAIAATN